MANISGIFMMREQLIQKIRLVWNATRSKDIFGRTKVVARFLVCRDRSNLSTRIIGLKIPNMTRRDCNFERDLI